MVGLGGDLPPGSSDPGGSSIRLLPESVYRRIAAGEVIERPSSVVRELLDNALDAQATSIVLDIQNGGLERICCSDDGVGMDRADLEICYLPHSTSKLNSVEDLDSLSTLGFRGEALGSIAACSRLEILSVRDGDPGGVRLKLEGGKLHSVAGDYRARGTTVTVSALFYSLPGRKKFLKAPSSEGERCRATLIEKALPFPEVAFTYQIGGETRLLLPPGTLKDRVAKAYQRSLRPDTLHTWEGGSEHFHYSMVVTDPSLYRRDRRFIQIYINQRRIHDYTLVQAVEHGFRDVLPGGCFPYAFVFLTLPPELVDFNVHPTKREARFEDLQSVRRYLMDALRKHILQFMEHRLGSKLVSVPVPGHTRQLPFQATPPDEVEPGGVRRHIAGERGQKYTPDAVSLDRLRAELAPVPDRVEGVTSSTSRECRYLGQIMNLFLLAECSDQLYLIDQHAAHERILFDEAESRWSQTQELIVPVELTLTPSQERALKGRVQEYTELGFQFESIGSGRWQLTAMPEVSLGQEDELVDFFVHTQGDGRELKKLIHSSIACRKAIMDGDRLDRTTAMELVDKTFALKEHRCPHGRPVWFILSRDELCRLVGRKQ